MTNLAYQDVLDLDDILFARPDFFVKIDEALRQIQSTDEGQVLLTRIDQLHGEFGKIDVEYDAPSAFGIFPGANATNSEKNLLRLSDSQLQKFDVQTTDESLSEINENQISLQRVLVHELYHLASGHVGTAGPSVILSAEDRAVYFSNQFMAKYYSEPMRAAYRDAELEMSNGEAVILTGFVEREVPHQEILVYSGFNEDSSIPSLDTDGIFLNEDLIFREFLETARARENFSIIDQLHDLIFGEGQNLFGTDANGRVFVYRSEYERALELINQVPEGCFVAGTPVSMVDDSFKLIETIQPGDEVVSYDTSGNLLSGKVTRTFQPQVKYVLDVHGLMVTPGHVTLCGDGKFAGQHVPMLDILRSDGALVRENGELVRACTNEAVGSDNDRFIQAITGERQHDGSLILREQGQIRLGTRYITDDGYDVSVADVIAAAGGSLTADGLILRAGATQGVPFLWPFGSQLPRPEDYVLQRSSLGLNDIYQAAEWETVPPRMPAPGGEAGRSDGTIAVH